MNIFLSHRCYLFFFFFFNDTATTEIYTLSLHDALPLSLLRDRLVVAACSVNFLSLFGLYGALFLLTIYLQEINGLTATRTGVRLIALTAAIMVAGFAASVLTARLGA